MSLAGARFPLGRARAREVDDDPRRSAGGPGVSASQQRGPAPPRHLSGEGTGGPAQLLLLPRGPAAAVVSWPSWCPSRSYFRPEPARGTQCHLIFSENFQGPESNWYLQQGPCPSFYHNFSLGTPIEVNPSPTSSSRRARSVGTTFILCSHSENDSNALVRKQPPPRENCFRQSLPRTFRISS